MTMKKAVIEYYDDGKRAAFDGHTFTLDERTGYYQATTPVGDRRKRLHGCVWESVNGPVPEGYVVHHKDHNKGNNDVSNLSAIPHGEHAREHLDCLLKYAVPAAKAWHRSEEGREWHRQHYQRMKHKLLRGKAKASGADGAYCERCENEVKEEKEKTRRPECRHSSHRAGRNGGCVLHEGV